MTWARVLATGSGKKRFRLEIEGWPFQFVSDSAMEAAGYTGALLRKVGLIASSISIEERAYPAEATIEASPITFQIADVALTGTYAFTRRPTITAWLTTEVDDTETTWDVSDSSLLVNGHYHIGTEVIEVTDRPDGNTIEVERGEWGTTAQAHFVEAGFEISQPEITNVPVLMQGRRAILFAYGEGESPVGNGTQIWRGVVAREPTISSDLTTWEVHVDPIWSIFDQEIGAELDRAVRLTGVYYAWTGPLCIRFQQRADATSGGSVAAVYPADGSFLFFTGRYQDNAELCRAINTAINASGASWLEDTTKAVATADGGWQIRVVALASPNHRYITVDAFSAVDGRTSLLLLSAGSLSVVNAVIAQGEYIAEWQASGDALVVAAGLDRELVPLRPRATPRASYRPLGRALGRGLPDPTTQQDPTATSSAPNNRIYLDRATSLAAGDQIVIAGSMDGGEITATDTTGYVEVDGLFRGVFGEVDGAMVPPIVVGQNYGTTDLFGFVSALVARAPFANGGGTPFILAADLELATWPSVTDFGTKAYLARRRYAFTKPTKLRELLEQELRLAGFFPYLTASGTVGCKPLTVPAETAVAAITINASTHVVGAGDYGLIATNVDGVINGVRVLTGWDAVEEKHLGRTYDVRDARSVSRLKRRRSVEIAPKIRAESEPTFDDVVDLAAGVMAMYGSAYQIVTLRVPYTHFTTVIGTTVSIDVAHLPFEGARGLDTRALVVGRRFALGQASGELDLFITGLNVVGYSPSGRVVDKVGSGTTWTLFLDDRYSGTHDAAFFVTGDKVQVIEFDDDTPTVLTGTVIAQTGDVVDVTFTGTWTPGASTWNLMFQPLDDVQSSQLEYGFCANASRLLNTVPARLFAP